MPAAADIAVYLDDLLRVAEFQDYDKALNGLQLDHRGPVHRVATAVDFSLATIDAAVAHGANLLVVHHGMFWGGTQPLIGPVYQRLSRLLANDIAVYASHLPLDAHPSLGNCILLAGALGLSPSGRFGEHHGVRIGCSGETRVPTSELLARAAAFAATRGGTARASPIAGDRVTARWAILTGAGGGSPEIRQAVSAGIDTLIVGEGPHHATVDAPDHGLVIIYAGHYASETLGVQALADVIRRQFRIPGDFLLLPTGS